MIAYFLEVFEWGWGDTAYWIIVAIGLCFLHKGWDKLAFSTIILALLALVSLSLWL